MKRFLLCLPVAALFLALSSAAWAHDDDDAPAVIPGQPPINGVVLVRILNNEQKTQYRDALEANREKMLALQKQVVAARKALLDVQVAEKFDEAAYRARVQDILKAQTEMEMLNAQAFAKVRPTLTPEQVQRLKTSPPLARPHGGPEARPELFSGVTAIPPQDHRPPTNGPQVVVPPGKP